MDLLTLKLIHIDHCRGLGRKTIRAFLKIDPTLQFLDCCTVKDLTETFHMTGQYAELFLKDFHLFQPDKTARIYLDRGISVIPVHSPMYPRLLKKIYDPPFLIYAKGRVDLLQEQHMLSVVGTRHPSHEVVPVMKCLLHPLIDRGWTIVSGMALGVDGIAHRLAMNGKTIAVLGSGICCPYPRQHMPLFAGLCSKQLVLSEYPPFSPPARWRFPERNRIISGMSQGTLVIEAREKSGSLITADQALEQGREVFAVPGSILNDNSKGTHRLIQQGAKLVTETEDILEELQNLSGTGKQEL
ncbi:DNA-processing protein DprA [Sporolactobacillus sp. Y61]|uniref:DNA-processing protein DprA n=1 Tax=Sporolactobacillus sp. Y61 TaxID=3160863 RepID=A0AAU8ICU8_9BACL